VGGPPPGGAPSPVLSQVATSSVEVAGTDILGVQLTLRPPLTLAGHLVFHGTTPAPALAGRRIPFQTTAARSAAMVAPSAGATDDKGAFTITGVLPGRYLLGGPLFFGATTDSVTWSVESVMADGKDITDLPLEIGDQVPKDVVVTYGDRWQQVMGRLANSAGAPLSN